MITQKEAFELEIQLLGVSRRRRESLTSEAEAGECTELWGDKLYATMRDGDQRPYLLPIDDIERKRQDLSQELWTTFYTELATEYGAPTRKPSAPPAILPHLDLERQGWIFDIGCGDAEAFTRSLTKRYPHIRVCGIDLAFDEAYQKDDPAEPLVDDCEAMGFDQILRRRRTKERPLYLINLRDGELCVRNVPRLMSSLHRGLSKGGWFQSQEMPIRAWESTSTAFEEWKSAFLTAAGRLGIPLFTSPELLKAVNNAGFRGVYTRRCTMQMINGLNAGGGRNEHLLQYVSLTVQSSYRVLLEGGIGDKSEVQRLLPTSRKILPKTTATSQSP